MSQATPEQLAQLEALKQEIATLETKIVTSKDITNEDTKFIGNLGWLTALSVSITALAASV